SSKMIDEGGYESESYYEYRHPASLAKGVENILLQGIRELQERGIN
ncbi:MAG: hypothetical protein HOC71_01930, partial [Candidatus Latescibacteria bacterium]|nr:hypothetical protein [Candidatus Latescibacterota bacterium]